jgi:hypothetical protein
MPSTRQIAKFASIVTLVSLSVAAFYSNRYGSPFPAFVVAAGISGISIVGVVIKLVDSPSRPAAYLAIGATVLMGVLISQFLFWFPSSFIGIDPDIYARYAEGVLQTGSIDAIQSNFYRNAPLALLLAVVSTLITDLPRSGLWVFGIALQVTFPLLAALLAREMLRYDGERRRQAGMVLATLLVALTKEIVKRGYWPIAQSLGMIFFMFGIFTLVYVARRPSERKKAFAVFLVFGVAMVFTHKLPPFLFVLSTVFILGVLLLSDANFDENTGLLYAPFNITADWIERLATDQRKQNLLVVGFSVITFLVWGVIAQFFNSILYVGVIGCALAGLVILTLLGPWPTILQGTQYRSSLLGPFLLLATGTMMAIQWFLVSGLGERVVWQIVVPLLDPRGSNRVILGNPAAAELYDPGFVGIFMHRQSFMTLAVMGAVAFGVLFLTRYRDNPHSVLLGTVCAAFFLTPFSLTVMSSSGIGIQRLFSTIVPALAAMIAVVATGSLIDVDQHESKRVKRFGVSLFLLVACVLLVSQIASAGFALDHPGTPRFYLEDSEISGKQHTNAYLSGGETVTTDYYFARESVAVLSGQTGTDISYTHSTKEILNGDVHYGSRYMMYRPNYELYYGPFDGFWYLTIDLESGLDGANNRIYDSNGTVLYYNKNSS